jgi:hypothetical protein
MNQQSAPSIARYSEKLWRYLPALEATSKTLQALKEQGINDGSDFYRILQEVLPGLKPIRFR